MFDIDQYMTDLNDQDNVLYKPDEDQDESVKGEDEDMR